MCVWRVYVAGVQVRQLFILSFLSYAFLFSFFFFSLHPLFISCPLCSLLSFFSSHPALSFCKPLTVIIWGHLEVQTNSGLGGVCVVLQSAVLAAKQQGKTIGWWWAKELQPHTWSSHCLVIHLFTRTMRRLVLYSNLLTSSVVQRCAEPESKMVAMSKILWISDWISAKCVLKCSVSGHLEWGNNRTYLILCGKQASSHFLGLTRWENCI